MKTVGKILLFLIALPFLYLVSGFIYETWTSTRHRYRLTFEVDRPSGPHRAEGVIEAHWTRKAGWVPQSGGALAGIHGDAIFIDLGDGKHVIATLTFPPNSGPLEYESLAAIVFNRRESLWFLEAPHWTGRGDLQLSQLPLLVTFGDLRDPNTARTIAPGAFEDVFGAGYRFKRATLEMVPVGWWPFNLLGLTGTPVTRGIEKRLPWWNDTDRYRSDPTNPFTSTLKFGKSHFRNN